MLQNSPLANVYNRWYLIIFFLNRNTGNSSAVMVLSPQPPAYNTSRQLITRLILSCHLHRFLCCRKLNLLLLTVYKFVLGSWLLQFFRQFMPTFSTNIIWMIEIHFTLWAYHYIPPCFFIYYAPRFYHKPDSESHLPPVL